MKLRYFLTSVFACLALAIGCTQEELPGLSEIQVTPSYFTFGVDGGAKTLTVTAADAWTVTDVPEWLNVSPAKGDAGAEIKVTVTAAATDQEKIRTATVKFNCAGVSQLVTIGQEAFVPDYPKFEAGEYWIMFGEEAAVPVSGTYGYLYTAKANKSDDGKLTSTADNIFKFTAVEGGFNIQDANGMYYYMKGTYDSFNVDASPVDGSVWTVQQTGDITFKLVNASNGKVMQYDPAYSSAGAYSSDRSGAIYPNLVNTAGNEIAEVLFAVEPTEVEIEKEAGVFNINMTCKNDGFEVKPNASWITLKGMTSTNGEYVVTFAYEANEGGARTATIDFVSGEETITVEVSQLGGIADMTVAEFLAAAEGPALYRLSGRVGKIANTTYGNFDLIDATGTVYVYGLTNNGATGSNDKSFASLGINEGDMITIIGTRAAYNGTAQVGGTAYLVSHDVAAQVATVEEFLAASVSSDQWYKLTGTVDSIVKEEYGNFYLKDETGTVYVYGVTSHKVAKNDKSFASLGVKAGDKITIVGTRAQYANASDATQKEQVGGPAYYVSHEAAPAGDDNTGTEGGDDNTGDTPATPAAAKYVQVTADQADWSGKYLIVWDGNAHASLQSGKKDLNSTVAVTVTDGAIEPSEEVNAAALTVTKNGEKYSMTFADGKFFGMQKNGCKLMDEAFDLSFEYTADGVKVSGFVAAENNTFILYHNSNNGDYYRCYVEKNGQAGYTLPTLYKYAE